MCESVSERKDNCLEAGDGKGQEELLQLDLDVATSRWVGPHLPGKALPFQLPQLPTPKCRWVRTYRALKDNVTYLQTHKHTFYRTQELLDDRLFTGLCSLEKPSSYLDQDTPPAYLVPGVSKRVGCGVELHIGPLLSRTRDTEGDTDATLKHKIFAIQTDTSPVYT